MAHASSHRVLVAGILSPFAAAYFGKVVYSRLTRASADPDQDFVFRLTVTALAMAVPFLVTLALAVADRRRQAMTWSGRAGLALAVLSLGLTWLPIQGAITRSRQTRNLALRGVTAPPFDTVDLSGNPQRLADHAGQVVIVNVWATWCGPCRREMPKLDRLYRDRKDQGLMVFGLSTEDLDVQRKFVEERVRVSYPLLTAAGQVPDMYRNTAQYPATFLIDRAGRLQPAPGTDQPFEKLEAVVNALLQDGR
jgi:peroxiredoxin